MLILKFIDDTEKNKGRFFKKRNALYNQALKRYSININGKPIIVVELTEKDLHREEVLTLLKMYKGKVLVSERYQNDKEINEYIYNPKEYYKRAVLSSLVNHMKTTDNDWNNIAIKTEKFSPFKEFYEVVRISRKITILTESNACTEKFLRECYYEYGAIVSVRNENFNEFNDVFLNLDTIDDKGKIIINVKSKDFVLYSDAKYFEYCSEYEKLFQYNIAHNIICSLFSDK